MVQATGAPALKTFTWGVPNCTLSACHGGVSVAWANGTITCDGCHSTTTNTKMGVVDVNNWTWDGTTQSKVSDQAGGEYAMRGHGKTTPATTCAQCHDSAVAHDLTMAGANPFRLQGGAGFSCANNTANCHDGAPTASVTTVVDHTSANMVTAGYTPQVGAWSYTPKCVDCHDPHGDGSNVRMIHADLWDNGSGANFVPTAYGTIGNTNVVFTDEATGVGGNSYAWGATAPNYSGLCQECHETADADFTSFKDDTSVSLDPHPAGGANPGDCSGCHRHREAFKPNLCEDCHDGSEALAPNVINGQTPYNAAVSYNWYGSVGTKHRIEEGPIPTDARCRRSHRSFPHRTWRSRAREGHLSTARRPRNGCPPLAETPGLSLPGHIGLRCAIEPLGQARAETALVGENQPAVDRSRSLRLFQWRRLRCGVRRGFGTDRASTACENEQRGRTACGQGRRAEHVHVREVQFLEQAAPRGGRRHRMLWAHVRVFEPPPAVEQPEDQVDPTRRRRNLDNQGDAAGREQGRDVTQCMPQIGGGVQDLRRDDDVE